MTNQDDDIEHLVMKVPVSGARVILQDLKNVLSALESGDIITDEAAVRSHERLSKLVDEVETAVGHSGTLLQ